MSGVASEKFDHKTAFPLLYKTGRKDWTEVFVPSLRFLAFEGHGDPNVVPEYKLAVESLYSVAYTLKFALKKRGQDFVVAPLEGLWSAADPRSFVQRRKDDWDWTMLIGVPPFVTDADIAAASEAAAVKKPELPLGLVHTVERREGRSLQILHLGSYDDEAPALARLHDEVMPSLKVTFNGLHHEIYLGDPRRSAPEKLKTILRQPIKDAATD